MRKLFCIIGFLCSVCLSSPAHAACEEMRDETARYLACRFDPAREEVRLHLAAPDGKPYGGFAALRRQLWEERRVLMFAMNAGMYHRDLSPVGYFAEYGRVLKPAVTGRVSEVVEIVWRRNLRVNQHPPNRRRQPPGRSRHEAEYR
ncbi:MAG: hypothetical protein ACK4SQ_14785, partial [Allorhizobium sp.]